MKYFPCARQSTSYIFGKEICESWIGWKLKMFILDLQINTLFLNELKYNDNKNDKLSI